MWCGTLGNMSAGSSQKEQGVGTRDGTKGTRRRQAYIHKKFNHVFFMVQVLPTQQRLDTRTHMQLLKRSGEQAWKRLPLQTALHRKNDIRQKIIVTGVRELAVSCTYT